MNGQLKENNQISPSVQQTLDRMDLIDRSIKLWTAYKNGDITKIQYKILQDATLKEIRENEKNG